MQNSSRPLSDVLREVINTDSIKVTLSEIKASLYNQGFSILIIIFSLPLSLIPVPPGCTIIFSIPLILFSLQLLFGFNSPWMPRWLEEKSVQRSSLVFMIEKTYPLLKKVEKFMKPRMLFIFYGPGEKILAFFMLLCAVSIAIPLPFNHFIPAMGMTFIALGTMNKDGFLSVLGVLISLFGFLLTLILIIKGPKLIFSFLKNFRVFFQ